MHYPVPRIVRFEFKAIALIKPDSYFNRVAVETVAAKINSDKLAIGFFDTVKQANEWLTTAPVLV